MKYAQAIENLYSLERRGVKLELSRVRDALEALGHPDRNYRIIHVAGTNGKGSICAMLRSCLQHAGHRTGLFTSPHLHRFTERIQIDGVPVTDSIFVPCAQRVLELEGRMKLGLSFFECAFLIACEAFHEAQCEWVVLETGLGGRLDATNTVTPVVTVISEISLDHTKLLGDTLEAIAAEKAGIIKRDVPVISGASAPAARQVIEARARSVGAPIVQLPHRSESAFALASGRALGLHGEHQRRNAAIAIATLARLCEDGLLPSAPKAFAEGLASVRWPGRIEVLEGTPTWILDAAHNPAGCDALAAHLSTLPRVPRFLVFGVMADKAHEEMLGTLEHAAERLIVTRPPVDRAASPAELKAPAGAKLIDNWRHAIQWAEQNAGPGDVLVACGSIFLVAAVRARLLGIESDPAIRM